MYIFNVQSDFTLYVDFDANIYTANSCAQNVYAIFSDVTCTTLAYLLAHDKRKANLYLSPKNEKTVSITDSNARKQIYYFLFDFQLFFTALFVCYFIHCLRLET